MCAVLIGDLFAVFFLGNQIVDLLSSCLSLFDILNRRGIFDMYMWVGYSPVVIFI